SARGSICRNCTVPEYLVRHSALLPGTWAQQSPLSRRCAHMPSAKVRRVRSTDCTRNAIAIANELASQSRPNSMQTTGAAAAPLRPDRGFARRDRPAQETYSPPDASSVEPAKPCDRCLRHEDHRVTLRLPWLRLACLQERKASAGPVVC